VTFPITDYIPPSAYNDDYGSNGATDFDSLLQKARAGLKKKWYEDFFFREKKDFVLFFCAILFRFWADLIFLFVQTGDSGKKDWLNIFTIKEENIEVQWTPTPTLFSRQQEDFELQTWTVLWNASENATATDVYAQRCDVGGHSEQDWV